VLPGSNGRLDQAYVPTPDGLRMEILEDKSQAMPIRSEQVHLFLPEAEIAKAQTWFAKTFGGKASTRNNQPVVDIPGVQIRFAKADAAQAPTKGHVLDHYGFDVKDHAAFVKKIEAEGIKLDEPPRHIAGRPTLQPVIRQCFEYAKQHAGVWFARRRDIAAAGNTDRAQCALDPASL
jgi:hypothetical protein